MEKGYFRGCYKIGGTVLYQKIAKKIKDKILSGEYVAGEKLDSETILANEYKTTKMTMRKALHLLVINGLIHVVSKSGYYVNNHQDIISFNSLNAKTLHSLYPQEDLTTRVISFEVITAPGFLIDKFSIAKGKKVFKIVRIRFVKSLEYSIEEIYMPYDLFPELDYDLALKSIYNFILERGHKIGCHRKSISASFVPKKYADEFPRIKNKPVLQIANTGFLSNGITFEYSLSYQINQDYTIITEYNEILN